MDKVGITVVSQRLRMEIPNCGKQNGLESTAGETLDNTGRKKSIVATRALPDNTSDQPHQGRKEIDGSFSIFPRKGRDEGTFCKQAFSGSLPSSANDQKLISRKERNIRDGDTQINRDGNNTSRKHRTL